jgi:trimethylamine--corrinoid protein Co-methyltransferase
MPSPTLSLLSEADRDFLHDRTLQVLAQTGAHFESGIARAHLAEAGCRVDEQSGWVRFSPDLVEWAISRLRRDVLLAARVPKHDVMLDGSTTFVTTTGICPSVVDLETGEHREPRLKDLADVGLVVDALEELDLCWYSVSPTADAPDLMTDLESLACLVANTGKHIQGQLVRPEDVPYALEIMRLAAPGADHRTRPIFSSLYCPVSPLRHGAQAVEAAMAMARESIPIDIYSLALSGATSPMSLAGTLIQTLAEELSAAVLFKVIDADCPLILTGNAGILDMSTSTYASATPECSLMNIALIEMIHSYNAPTQSIALAMDSCNLGFRGGLENMGVGLLTWLARPDMMTGLGGVGGAQALSLAKLLLDAELVQYFARLEDGVALDEERGDVDAIDRVAPHGHFLAEKATVKLLRSGEHWLPTLLRRGGHDEWQRQASDESTLAKASVKEILASHEAPPLPEGAAEAIELVLVPLRGERSGDGSPYHVSQPTER